MTQRIDGLLKTRLLKKTSFECMESLEIEAAPPPLSHPLVENKKLKFGWEASVRTTGASVPSHVSVRIIMLISFIIKDLFKRERTFSSTTLMSALNECSSQGLSGMLKAFFDLKTVLGLSCMCEIIVVIV